MIRVQNAMFIRTMRQCRLLPPISSCRGREYQQEAAKLDSGKLPPLEDGEDKNRV